jgi:cellulose synthase/poly-beta-1,6-N-acetylglucosamine synthase-like glycosyltransferase
VTPVTIVVPTTGRPSLSGLLDALATEDCDARVVLVDDRRAPGQPLPVLPGRTVVVRGTGSGPAAARNAGWRVADTPWVAFLDDDVVPEPGWFKLLQEDLAVPETVGGVAARITVPLPAGRRPTDWERNTAGLATARWITADMAYRRAALEAVGGFDERFTRAYREDADLAYRVRQAGWSLRVGERHTVHPVRPTDALASLRVQRGNADDALLRRRYGPQWRSRLDIPTGRRLRHAAITAAGALALGAAARRRPVLATAATVAWAAGTAEFARARIAPGPRTPYEISLMVATSALIPPLAVGHWLLGWWRHRSVERS